MLSLLEECPAFKRNAIKGDRVQYTWNITRLSLLINISNNCVWGDEKGKHVCHPATTWNVSSLGVNLLYRTADCPENLEFPFGARWSQACSCLFCFHSWAVSWLNACHACIFVTSHSISLKWYLGIHLQAWPKKLAKNQWILFSSLPHNYFFPI